MRAFQNLPLPPSTWAILKKLSNTGKDILRKKYSYFVNLNVMYAYGILCQASVCNIQAACYILALLETLIEIFFVFIGMA